MTANNSTLDPIPAPSPENTEHLGFTVGVGPDQTVTTRPACRRWGHFKPSRLDLPTPVVGPSRTANPGPDQTVRAKEPSCRGAAPTASTSDPGISSIRR